MNKELRQALKAQAHHLKPVVLVGAKGLTAAVVEETHCALQAHELIKVKISGVERDDRKIMVDDLCQQLQAHLVQMLGHTAIVYRKRQED